LLQVLEVVLVRLLPHLVRVVSRVLRDLIGPSCTEQHPWQVLLDLVVQVARLAKQVQSV
jgi:hypothetical protein